MNTPPMNWDVDERLETLERLACETLQRVTAIEKQLTALENSTNESTQRILNIEKQLTASIEFGENLHRSVGAVLDVVKTESGVTKLINSRVDSLNEILNTFYEKQTKHNQSVLNYLLKVRK